jgi:SAM-dependent methyltransferase
MLPFTQRPVSVHRSGNCTVASFVRDDERNIDPETVDAFADEWQRFDAFSQDDIDTAGGQYFDVVDARHVSQDAVVLDAGCGSGRWSRYLAPRVRAIEAVDPSEAIFTAARRHTGLTNVRFTRASIANLPFEDEAFDFVICLGVLHHMPDTEAALHDLVKKLKPGGHLLLYLYYALDNRGCLYRGLFRASALGRRIVSRLPHAPRNACCDALAFLVYLPLVWMASTVARVSPAWARRMPLHYYRDKSLQVIRNDARDRFGTPLEQRFSREVISRMLQRAGMGSIRFSESEPFWHCVSTKT